MEMIWTNRWSYIEEAQCKKKNQRYRSEPSLVLRNQVQAKVHVIFRTWPKHCFYKATDGWEVPEEVQHRFDKLLIKQVKMTTDENFYSTTINIVEKIQRQLCRTSVDRKSITFIWVW